MGWYSRKVFEEQKLPKILPALRPIYEDPVDPRFRVYEVNLPPGMSHPAHRQ